MYSFIRQTSDSTIAINGVEITVQPGQIDRWIDRLMHDPEFADRIEEQVINSMIRESFKIQH